MKVAAIKGRMGIWTYYITAMHMDDIAKYVNENFPERKRELNTEKTKQIKDFLMDHDDRFLNTIVIAVFGGSPNWYGMEVKMDDFSSNTAGILELSGNERMYAVNGHEQIKAIRSALKSNKKLCQEDVPVVLIGNYNTDELLTRTRKLSSILNYLKEKKDNNWIPISSRLPTREEYLKDDGRFILDDGNRRYLGCFDIYDGKFKFITHIHGMHYEIYDDNRVIAWQPLPDKYERT